MSEEPRYKTSKGVDEQVIEKPYADEEINERLRAKGIQVINWHGLRMFRNASMGLGTAYFDELQHMRNQQESIMIVITAKPGMGKTYHALRFAQIFDPKFDVTLQVAFTREQILYLIGPNSPLKRGQVIIIDEAQFSAGARSWFEEVQKMLMNSLASIRSKGLIIIVVTLHLDLMDKILRKYVLSYMHHMERRGKATIYRLYTPRFESEMRKKKITQLYLKLPDIEKCTHHTCLTCKHKHDCMSIRAVYERAKLAFIDKKSAEAEAKARAKAMRDNLPTKQEMVEMVMVHSDKLTITNRGSPDWSSVQDVLDEEYNLNVGRSVSVGLASTISRKYKDELTQLREDRKNAEKP